MSALQCSCPTCRLARESGLRRAGLWVWPGLKHVAFCFAVLIAGLLAARAFLFAFVWLGCRLFRAVLPVLAVAFILRGAAVAGVQEDLGDGAVAAQDAQAARVRVVALQFVGRGAPGAREKAVAGLPAAGNAGDVHEAPGGWQHERAGRPLRGGEDAGALIAHCGGAGHGFLGGALEDLRGERFADAFEIEEAELPAHARASNIRPRPATLP